MKQTAVEWLLTYLPQIDYGNDPYYIDIINQAKEMEKQQIIDAYSEGDINGIMGNRKMAEQYYNETFKQL
jgi:hypothetical protein